MPNEKDFKKGRALLRRLLVVISRGNVRDGSDKSTSLMSWDGEFNAIILWTRTVKVDLNADTNVGLSPHMSLFYISSEAWEE